MYFESKLYEGKEELRNLFNGESVLAPLNKFGE